MKTVGSPDGMISRMLSRLVVCALALAPFGCSYGITVRHAAGPGLLDSWRASVVEADELSPRTRQTLRRWDIDRDYDRAPADAYLRLHAAAVKDPEPDLLFALAEITYLLGRKHEKAECGEACAYYYLCAGYAYHYLFDQDSLAGNAFDPRFRLACDLYNTGLAKCIAAAQHVGRLDPREQLALPGPDKTGFRLSVVHHGFPWLPEEFGPLLFAADYEVVGLANQYRGYGLGVALIGTRLREQGRAARPSPLHFPSEVSFPVTAFFRFEGSVAELGARHAGRLELYNPLVNQTVDINGRAIPLETDLTTPLAYFLSRTDLDGIEYTGFLRGDQIRDRSGIYAFEPYQPGKIPVVMVHGLLASPLTWTTMFNDLRADSVLRKNYQFWFYLYPTGDPYLLSAADLRQELNRVRTELDPERRDPALDNMVFVGHSMGGLVAKLLTEDSGSDFWNLVSRQPFDAIKVGPQTRAEIERIFFFQSLPCVRRVVFIGTPHHGSRLSPSPPARLVARFIQLPKRLLKVAGEVAREDPQALSNARPGQIPTSLDALAPGAPGLELLAARSSPAGVHFHSIVGVAFGKGAEGSDGVVPFASAHLDGVDSEIVVPATHSYLHHDPGAILEVWRILVEHLQEVNGRLQAVRFQESTLPALPLPEPDSGKAAEMKRITPDN